MKVLVVDDDKDITDMLSMYFDSQHISCKIYNEGRQGLEAIRREDSDLILLDVTMPAFSGLDIISALDKEQLLQSKNVILFTALSLDEQSNMPLLAHLKGQLKKPPSLSDLGVLVAKFKPITKTHPSD